MSATPASTLCSMFDHTVASAPDKVAIRHLGAVLTYRELGLAVAALARRLAAMVAPGEVVAIVLPNSIEFHVAYFAALKALAAPGLLNPVYPAVELAPLLRQAAPRAVLCAPPTRDMLTGLARDLRIPNVVCLGQDFTVRDLVAEPEAPVACGPPRLQTSEYCCSAAAPLDLPRVSSTHMVAWSSDCAEWSTCGRRRPIAKFSFPLRPSPTSMGSWRACSFQYPPKARQ